ncbi:MAG: GIDE domain-containing protein [Nevskiales bacterium]
MQELILSLAQAEPRHFWLWTGGIALVALFGFWTLVHSLGKARLILDTPTSKIRSAAQGYLELEGDGRLLPGDPIRCPLSGTRCIWWRYIIEEKQTTYRNGRRESRWTTIDQKTSDSIFELEDETGSCIVDPAGADVRPSLKRSWYGSTPWPQRGPGSGLFGLFARYRYREELVKENDELYVIGLFRTQRAADGGHFDEAEELRALVTEWKQDQQKLLARFDVNKDGKLDMKEWEAMRRVALQRVRRDQIDRAITPGLHVLTRPTDGRPFLLSTVPQHKLIRHYRWSAFGGFVLFATGFVVSAWLLLARNLLSASG